MGRSKGLYQVTEPTGIKILKYFTRDVDDIGTGGGEVTTTQHEQIRTSAEHREELEDQLTDRNLWADSRRLPSWLIKNMFWRVNSKTSTGTQTWVEKVDEIIETDAILVKERIIPSRRHFRELSSFKKLRSLEERALTVLREHNEDNILYDIKPPEHKDVQTSADCLSYFSDMEESVINIQTY